jgi:hypothetical protein
MTNNTGGPAFPGFDYIDQHGKKNPEGMTLRDYFAANALQGYCSDPDWRIDMDFSDTAHAAYSVADAMLKAREA